MKNQKLTPKPDHTEGPLTVEANNGSNSTQMPFMILADGKWIADVKIQDVAGEAFANAQRIVKAVNMHDELTNTVRDILESFYHTDGSCHIKKDSIIHKRLQLLLKQAEQK